MFPTHFILTEIIVLADGDILPNIPMYLCDSNPGEYILQKFITKFDVT